MTGYCQLSPRPCAIAPTNRPARTTHLLETTAPPVARCSARNQGVVPIYLANVIVLGLTWGLVRVVSGSIIVASFCHAVWNALVYEFFRYGSGSGSLGIAAFNVFDPERGWAGLGIDLVVLLLLWRWWRRNEAETQSA